MAEKDPYDLANYADMDVQTVRSALHTLTFPDGLSSNQQVLLDEIKRMIDLILYNNKLSEGKLINLIDRTESILRDNNRPIKLLAQPPDGERYLLSHSLNTYLISFLLGMELDFSDDKILELAGAAICQDLGMTEIPMGLWAKKEGELTGRGWQEIQKHPLHTARILEDTIGEEDPMADLARQHHEHRDGSGYPGGITIEDQHPLAPVLCVADDYTAMLEERPHRSGLSPDEVLLTMLKNDSKFDRTVVNSMLKIIGFYPTGSVVLLKDQRLALVREQNDGEPLAPKLFILTDQKRNKLENPRPADLTKDELDIHQVVKF
ncbi:MAG: HD-GYP domain-containing protein [bacterium]